MSDFDRLHPAVQYHVVNSLGWSDLRPLQADAIATLLDGRHALLLAPTAAGKTEAAALPLFSRMLSEDWKGLSVLYLCPLRALLNNLEPRLERFASLLGRRVGLWHGDVAASIKNKLRRKPPDLLLTTPESLEGMLVSRTLDRSFFLGAVRAVVVDEIHAFAGDDRGWHLLGLLGRLRHLLGREVQRVGLSATVGNPRELLDWLTAGSDRQAVVIAPAAPGSGDHEIVLDHVGSLDNAAHVISRLHAGDKRLVFCDSRARVEMLATRLRETGVDTLVSHSSLAASERRRAEEAFAEGQNCVIVATSTLELGIDVGDLDRVLQIDAPAKVASFLQRMGRTGRRAGTTSNTTFLTTSSSALLRAAGLLVLWSEGHVEPVQPPPYPAHVLSQQILALTLQNRGIHRRDPALWLRGFALLEKEPGLGGEILEHLEEKGILWDEAGRLWFGREGEDRLGRRNFLELLSLIQSPPLFTVYLGRKELGHVHPASFVTENDEVPVLLLGGRRWRIRSIDWDHQEAFVDPTTEEGRSRWPGDALPLRYELCQAIRRVMAGEADPPGMSRRATEALEAIRQEYSWVGAEGTVLLRARGESALWWTFAGIRANAMLATALEASGLAVGLLDNLYLDLPLRPDPLELKAALRDWDEEPPGPRIDPRAARRLKFGDCLPEDVLHKVLSRRGADPEGFQSIVNARIRSVDLSAVG